MMPPKRATNSKNKFPDTLEPRSHLKDKLEIFSLFSNLYLLPASFHTSLRGCVKPLNLAQTEQYFQ